LNERAEFFEVLQHLFVRIDIHLSFENMRIVTIVGQFDGVAKVNKRRLIIETGIIGDVTIPLRETRF